MRDRVLLPVCISALLVLSATALADEKVPAVFSFDEKVEGSTYAEWSARW